MFKHKQFIIFLAFSIILLIECQNVKLVKFETSSHNKNCYSQGLFFLNNTHVVESCGLYNKSYFHLLKYEKTEKGFSLTQTFKSSIPIDPKVFLEGITYLPKTQKMYLLTWRENKVYQINSQTFDIENIRKWPKDGWGLTNNQTHMFVTDGGPIIYVVNENFQILQEKTITDSKGKKQYSINELEYVIQNEIAFIYANIYMQRRIIKIDLRSNKIVKQYDMTKIIQNQKGLKYDEVINGIAKIPKAEKYLLTGKNWGNFYEVDFN